MSLYKESFELLGGHTVFVSEIPEEVVFGGKKLTGRNEERC